MPNTRGTYTEGAASWQRIWSLFDAALERQPEERTAFVRAVCAHEPELQDGVLGLLAAHEQPSPLDEDVQLDLPTPERIGPYVLLDQIGRGGMGIVFKARDERLHRLVALKMLPPHLNADSTAKDRFTAEARAAARLEHPNIAAVHDIGETPDGRLFIAMGYYEGETLDRHIARGALEPEPAAHIAEQIAVGLGKAHDAGIVHRDVKPSNILLTADGGVRILDFGVAKMADLDLTQSGSTPGTVAYMSPEQARGTEVDARSDIWSLGVVLYEMLSGAKPFKGDRRDSVLYTIVHEPPAPLSSVRPDVPPLLQHIVERALSKNPGDRFASARECARALSSYRQSANRSPGVHEHAPEDQGSGPSRSAARNEAPGRIRNSRADEAPGRIRNSAADEVSDRTRNPTPDDSVGRTRSPAAGDPSGDVPERIRATAVVSHLHGYVQWIEELVPEKLADATERVRSTAAEIVGDHGGILYNADGESLTALFGIPSAHEDDCMRAARAAVAIHAAIEALGSEIEQQAGRRLHPATGIDAGVMVVRENRSGSVRVTGTALQLATQLALHASRGDILLSPECERLVRPFFDTETLEGMRFKGASAVVTPYRLRGETGLESRIEAAKKAGLSEYTGRDRELETLEQALEHAVTGRGQFVTVTGDAGLGKSRLLYELEERIRRPISPLKGRCHAYGGKVPYRPFVVLLREHLRLDAGSPDTIEERAIEAILEIDPSLEIFLPLYLHLLSVESNRHPVPDHLKGEDLRMALVEALAGVFTLSAREGPLVLLLEDWHWSDEASQEVLRQIAELSSSYSLLVVVTYRPEYQAEWSRLSHHSAVQLKPLDESSSAAIMRSVLRADDLPRDLVSTLHQRTGGNPFFLEEVCRTLLEEGDIAVHDGRAALRAGGELQIPDTVQAVIRTRLHRLDPRARRTVRAASVIGREFSGRILRAIVSEDSDAPAALETLRDLGLIEQTRVVPEAAYRFKHVLTQDVVYDTLLQHQRKALHAAVGGAVECIYSGRLDEHLDVLVFHFSRAEDWQRAAMYGRQAALRATRLSQFTEAGDVYKEVRTWLRRLPDEVRRSEIVDVLLEHERICETIGDRAEQQQIIDELLTMLRPGGDPALLAEIYRRQGDLHVLRRHLDAAADALREALELARSAGAADVERRTLRSIGFLKWNEGHSEDAVALNRELLHLHRESGDDRAVVGDLVNLSIIMRNDGRFDEALVFLEEAGEVLKELDSPSVRSYVLHSLGITYHLLGNTEKGIQYLQQARGFAEKHRLPLQLSFNLMSLGHIFLVQGRVDESIAHYKEAIELSRRSRYADGLAKSLLVFGEILLNLNRLDEALPYLSEAADWFQQMEDVRSESETLAKMAAVYEKAERIPEATRAWERIGSLLDELDPHYELDVMEAFARLARLRGRDVEALSHYQDAIDLAERMGDDAREGRLRNTAGILAWQRSDYDEAVRHYERGLEAFRRIGDDAGAGLMMNSIGATLHHMERHEAAAAMLRDALELHRRSGNRQLEAHALATLGDVQLAGGYLDQALDAYSASLQIRWDIDDRRGEGWMLHRLARTHAARGEEERAADYARQAFAVARELRDRTLEQACEDVLH